MIVFVAIAGVAVGFSLGIAYTMRCHRTACRSRLPYIECPWNERKR